MHYNKLTERVLEPAPVKIVSRIPFSRSYILALGAGIVTVATVYGIDVLLARIKLPAEATILDDILVGILVAALVMSLEIHHQRELQRQNQALKVVQEMNHHIRNALQTIVYVTFNIKDKEAVNQINDATERIEWALREVLPRNSREALPLGMPPTDRPAWPPSSSP